MADLTYRITNKKPTEADSFLDASADELRVLLALIESGSLTISEIAKKVGVSEPRCRSAVALWEAEGLVSGDPCNENSENTDYIRVIDDPSSYAKRDTAQLTSLETAELIRDENLAMLIEECTILMDKATLATVDVKNITELYTTLALSPEYVIALAAYLKDKGKLTGANLRYKAQKLVEKDISTVEELERYIKDAEKSSGEEWEIRRIIGIYNRNLTDTEREAFKKWTEEYRYSTEIISLAFDKTVSGTGGNVSLPYMDKILSGWHEAGCKTLSDCKKHSEATKPEKGERRKRQSKTEAPKPRYGDFDTDEALRAALARSFTDDN